MKPHLFIIFLSLISIATAAEEEAEFLEIIQSPPPPSEQEILPEPADASAATETAPPPDSTVTEIHSDEITTEPGPTPTENQKGAPEKKQEPSGPKRIKFPGVDQVLIDPPLPPHPHSSIPKSLGDTSGEVFLAHRSVVEKYNGWGWIKKESEPWSRARWSAVREQLGKVILPGRHLSHPDNDADMQYRFYGEFSKETAYEPNKDVFVPIFDLKGFELIGKAKKPSGASLPTSTTGATRSKPTTGGARSNPFNR